jgi:hypothetical protein
VPQAVCVRNRHGLPGRGYPYGGTRNDDLSFENATFDSVVSMLTFHHLTNPVKRESLNEIAGELPRIFEEAGLEQSEHHGIRTPIGTVGFYGARKPG